MKQVNLLLMSVAMTLAACGGTKEAGQAGGPPYGGTKNA